MKFVLSAAVVAYVTLVALLVSAIVAISSASAAVPTAHKPTVEGPLGEVRAWEVSCSTTKAALAPSSGFIPRSSFQLKNTGSVTVFIGARDTVDATTNGYPIAAGEAQGIDSLPGVWGCITASSTATLEMMGGST